MFLGLTHLRRRPRASRNNNLHRALFFLVFLALPASAASDQLARAQMLDQRSAIETDSGDYAAAIRDATAAAAIHAARGDVRSRASSVNQAGLAQTYSGDYPAARASLELALRLATSAGDAEGQVEELLNLASVDYFTGRYGDAAAHYAAAGRIIDAHGSEAWTARRRRILLANQATLDQRLGRYDQALAAYRRALAGAADIRPGEHAQMLVNLGVVYRRLGDPYQALTAYDQALKLFASDRLLDGELGVLKNRGIVLALDLGRLEEARATFADALSRATAAGSQREALQARLYGAETMLRLGDLVPAARDFRLAAQTALELDSVEDRWKALYGLARCETRAGDVASAATHLRAAIDVIEKIREDLRVPSLKSDFFNDKREVFDALIAIRVRQHAGAAELFALIERGHSRAWRDRLGLRAVVDLASIQRALPVDAVLLDYWTSSAGAAVVIVTKSSASVRGITVDDGAIRQLLDALPRGTPYSGQAVAAKIASQLLPPMPHDAPHLIVVPDTRVAALPFELLPKDGSLVIEQHDVTYAPTAAILLRAAAPVRRFAPPWSVQFRGFGDPLFSSAALDDATRLRGRLAGSAREIRAIASELGGRSLLYLGADDTRQNLARSSPAPLLHLASHAFVDPGAIEQSRILFSAESKNAAAGYLFLKEAYELPLRGVELAVLSACDTERGKPLAGEGIESFSRAFLAAGAQTTVTTLWRVPDETTAAFMRLYYHHLQRGETRAAALRLTKLRFLRSGTATANPHYWAPFVLTGDGLRPVSTAVRWRSMALAAALVVSIAAGVIGWRRRTMNRKR